VFDPNCQRPGKYLPLWYRNKQSFAKANPVRVHVGHSVTGIDARLKTGGAISGTVRSQNGKPLRGICVDATLGNPETGEDFFASNGNYLGATYPHPVEVALGKTVRGIDGGASVPFRRRGAGPRASRSAPGAATR
jgi:hypothetical protein